MKLQYNTGTIIWRYTGPNMWQPTGKTMVVGLVSSLSNLHLINTLYFKKIYHKISNN